jgi:16S rRNA (guanine527-N7)-methyltransferase
MFHVKHQITRISDPQASNKWKELYKSNRVILDNYVDQLLWWNQKINLVSRNVSRETLQNHIRHSLFVSVLGALDEYSHVIDSGTGGGLPGIPLAICHPEKQFLFNDIVKKKILAVQSICRELGLKNTSTFAGSAEGLPVGKTELLISKHAFKIHDLLKMLGDGWEEIVLLKGIEFEDELKGLNEALSIKLYDLYEISGEEFYKGKAMLKIRRANELE